MKVSTFVGVGLAGVLCAVASADVITASYGWEDGGTILGSFGNLGSFNNADAAFVNSGSRSLGLTEDPVGGTPQAYVAYIEGLEDGDVIDASFFAWDDTPGQGSAFYQSIRIWAHYAVSGDVTSFNGSAGGNDTFSGDQLWTQLSNQWTFDSNGGERDALVIEVRLYSASDAEPPVGGFYVDDLEVAVTRDGALDGVTITTPVPAPGALALLGLAGIAARRRRA